MKTADCPLCGGNESMIEDIEAAAKRVYDVMPQMGLTWKYDEDATPDLIHETMYLPLPWEHVAERYRDYCRRVAAAALGVEEKQP